MIVYQIPGVFERGMTWEDFVPVETSRPFVTIDASPGMGEVEFVFDLSDDGGYDAVVSPALTPETAKIVLAAICKVDPCEIEIHEGID